MQLLAATKLNIALKCYRFSDIANIQGHAMTNLNSIPEVEFQKSSEPNKY
jgi:hypothetical protein